MQCKCGGSLLPRVSRDGSAVLYFGECEGCKRVGSESLYIDGNLAAKDTDARTKYQNLKRSTS